jgi:hypothetical protein
LEIEKEKKFQLENGKKILFKKWKENPIKIFENQQFLLTWVLKHLLE